MQYSSSNFKAFTLIELLIAVAVIGILVSLVTQNFLESRVKAQDANAKSSVREYKLALEQYNAQYKSYFVYDHSKGCVAKPTSPPVANGIKGYSLAGTGLGCVGLNGASEGGVTRQKGTAGELPVYGDRSIASVLSTEGMLATIQTIPGVNNFDKKNLVDVGNNRQIMQDFVLTLCDEEGKEANSIDSARNYAVYVQVKRTVSTDKNTANHLCGSSGTPGAWGISQTY